MSCLKSVAGKLSCSITKMLRLQFQVNNFLKNELFTDLIFPGEMVRWGIVPSSSKTRMKRVLATDGTKDGLTGVCIFFLRPRHSKAITSANISEELQCGQFDARGGLTLLQVIREYMQLVMLPALQQGQHWGNLQQKQVDAFMSTFRTYIKFLESMI